MAKTAGRRRRDRGSVDQLPSGRFRVRVYAGVDPLTGRQRYLVETAATEREAERARTRLLTQVDERRQPRTNATVEQLLDRYFEVLDVEDSTRKAYVGYARGHIRPVLGKLQVARVGAEVLDTFYAELRRCRARCTPAQRRAIEHRTTREHVCDRRCAPHRCRPLAASSIRQIHWILSGAFERAVKWQWIAVSPMSRADVPALPTPSPQPPSVEEAARIASEAWKDPDWGALVWVAMTTGIRRGELCGLRRCYVDLANQVLVVPRSVGGSRGNLQEKDTKTHQQRRIALDSETLEVLREHIQRSDERAAALELTIAPDAFLFSLEPDCSAPLLPGSVTHRYERMVKRLGIKTTLHKMRHYNATELIAAGVDVRTVAGRLGHGGGGTTTLRVYAAWVSEADQKAARALAGRLPKRP